MNNPILMYGDEPIGQLYKNSKAQSTSIARVVTNPLAGDGISQGSGFMLDGKRCVALVNIATGTTMVEHTHYEYESVEEKIYEVNGLHTLNITISESNISNALRAICSQIASKENGLYLVNVTNQGNWQAIVFANKTNDNPRIMGMLSPQIANTGGKVYYFSQESSSYTFYEFQGTLL